MKRSSRQWLVLALVSVVVSLGCQKNSGVVADGPHQHTIVILPKGSHGQAKENPQVHAGDQVRWRDTSKHAYTLHFDDLPGPLVGNPDPIEVQSGSLTMWYTVAPAGGAQRPKFYSYGSKTTQLEGPPDPPGMIVED